MFIASSKNFAPVDVLFAKLYTPKQVLFFSLEILWLNACTCKLDIRHTWVKSDANLYWEYEEQFPYYIFLKNWLLKEKFWVQLKFRRKYRKFFHSLSTEQVQLAPISIPQHRCMLVTTDESPVTDHYQPQVTVCMGALCWYGMFQEFWPKGNKTIWTCMLVSLSLLVSGNPWSSYPFIILTVSGCHIAGMIQEESLPDWLLLLRNSLLSSSHIFCGS